MRQVINQPVTVISQYQAGGKFRPVKVIWQGREYHIIKTGMHHVVKQADLRYHIFSCSSEQLFFRLKLDAQHLTWTLEEIHDGQAD